jgi:hypothetical protein
MPPWISAPSLDTAGGCGLEVSGTGSTAVAISCTVDTAGFSVSRGARLAADLCSSVSNIGDGSMQKVWGHSSISSSAEPRGTRDQGSWSLTRLTWLLATAASADTTTRIMASTQLTSTPTWRWAPAVQPSGMEVSALRARGRELGYGRGSSALQGATQMQALLWMALRLTWGQGTAALLLGRHA